MLKNRQDLIALREGCMAAAQLQKRRILVCAGTGCVSSGSLKIFDRLKELIEANGTAAPSNSRLNPMNPASMAASAHVTLRKKMPITASQ